VTSHAEFVLAVKSAKKASSRKEEGLWEEKKIGEGGTNAGSYL